MKITPGTPVIVKWHDAQVSEWYPQIEIYERSVISIASIGAVYAFQDEQITIMHNESDEASDYLTIPMGSVQSITPLVEKKKVKKFNSIKQYELVKVVWGDAEFCSNWTEKSSIPCSPREVQTYGLFAHYSPHRIVVLHSVSEDDECVSIQIPTQWIYDIVVLRKGGSSWHQT